MGEDKANQLGEVISWPPIYLKRGVLFCSESSMLTELSECVRIDVKNYFNGMGCIDTGADLQEDAFRRRDGADV